MGIKWDPIGGDKSSSAPCIEVFDGHTGTIFRFFKDDMVDHPTHGVCRIASIVLSTKMVDLEQVGTLKYIQNVRPEQLIAGVKKMAASVMEKALDKTSFAKEYGGSFKEYANESWDKVTANSLLEVKKKWDKLQEKYATKKSFPSQEENNEMASATKIANAVCEILEAYGATPTGGYSMSTQEVIRRLQGKLDLSSPIPDEKHQAIRRLMDALCSNNVLSKRSGKKHLWQLIHKNWDHSDPFGGKLTPGIGIGLNAKVAKVPGDSPYIPIGSFVVDDPAKEAGEAEYANADKEEKVPANFQKQIDRLAAMIGDLSTDLKERISNVEKHSARLNRNLEITLPTHEVVKLKNVTIPKVFQQVLDLAAARRNIMLVGPAGCGKTYIGKLVADSLRARFGAISCTAGMSESYLTGRSIPNLQTGTSDFQTTEFLEMYEGGGVFLWDEVDAADANMLLVANSAIGNDYCSVPFRTGNPRAMKHKDFIMIATANTHGRGASRTYVGRNQLDESTLDRFRMGMVECDFDEAVEAALCPDTELRETLQKIRRGIERAKLRRIMSSRFMQDAYIMSKVGWDQQRILDTYFLGWTPEEKSQALAEY